MIRAILFDVDGLLISPREKLFSDRFAEEYDVPSASVAEFFQSTFKKCSLGEYDLKEELAEYLPAWGWKGSVDSFLTYWFSSEATVEKDALHTVDMLRERGFTCYIATRQEKYRMQYLLDTVGLRSHFDGYFCSSDIGHDKKDPQFYEYILEHLALAPEEVLYFDDAQTNVDAARVVGVEAHLYSGREVLDARVADLLAG